MSIKNDNFGPDPIIAEINSGKNLFSYQTIEKQERWISDGMQEEMKTWRFPTNAMPSPVFITAAPGAGKSTFILNELADYAYRGCDMDSETRNASNILLLSNRWALSLQQKMQLNKRNGDDNDGSSVVNDILQFRNILVSTYQNVLEKISSIKARGPVSFVVFDEAHFFVSDSTFNPETSNILQGLLYAFYDSYRIYMTATPEEVKPIIAAEEYKLRQYHLAKTQNSQNLRALVQMPQIHEYKFRADYKSHIQLYFFRQKPW